MDSLSIKNGHVIDKTDNYVLYKITINDNQKYYMCLPTLNHDSYQMIIDFPEEYYKSLLEAQMITEIKRIYDNLLKHDTNNIYVLSNITTYELHQAESENDKRAYQLLLSNLQKCTYDAYNSLNRNDINISNVIGIILQTSDDKKFMHYLDTMMPGLFKGINLDYLLNDELTNEDNGWTTMGGPVNSHESLEHNNNLSKPKVKKLMPSSKHGFLNITFVIMIICLSLVLGIALAVGLIS